MYGELIPLGGGDAIPLLKKQLLVGRRESCDIVLRFANVSAHHCQLYINGGYWYVRDMKSRNGVKVNGIAVQEKRIDPGDQFAVAKHKYKLAYSPADLGAVGPPPRAERGHCTFTTPPTILPIAQPYWRSPAFLGVKVTVTALLSGSFVLMP